MNKGTLCQVQRQEEKEHGMVQEPKEAGIRSGEGSRIVEGHLAKLRSLDFMTVEGL